MSDSLQPHGLQHARLPCPSLSPRVCSNSCPLSWWCYITISSFAALFSFHFQSFPASGSFPMSCPFALGGPSIGASASASVLPMNIQGWFPLALTSLISLLSKGLSRVLHHHNLKASILQCSAFFMVQLSNLYLTTGKTIALTVQIFVGKVMSLLFNMLSRFVKVFLPYSKHLLISWLQLSLAVILEAKGKKKPSLLLFFPLLFAMKWWEQMSCSYVFWMLSFKPAFSLSSFTII